MSDGPPAILSVPTHAIRTTAAILRSAGAAEACCFWFGRRDSAGSGFVEAILVPQQQNRPGNYHVAPEAMIRVADAVRNRGWKNLAQIHSHPGDGVQHSGYDDQMANSRRALSLVFPRYGRMPGAWRWRAWIWRLWPAPFPRAIGVHAFRDGRWVYLDPPAISLAIRLVSNPAPAVIDLRS
jgi:hypothetical protein